MAENSGRSNANGLQAHGQPQEGEQHFDQRSEKSSDGHLKSRVVKRSLVVGGHKTSVSLEDVFWNALRSIAHERHLHLSELVGSIDSERQHCNLSSAIRLFVFEHLRDTHQQSEPRHAGVESSVPRRS